MENVENRHHRSRNGRHCSGSQVKPLGLSDCRCSQPQPIFCPAPGTDGRQRSAFMILLRTWPIMPILSLSPPRMMLFPVVVNQVRWHRGQYVVHCSGADSLDVLEPARMVGAQVGSFHPLQTFASIQKAIDNLPGSTFALEAEGDFAGYFERNGRWLWKATGSSWGPETKPLIIPPPL